MWDILSEPNGLQYIIPVFQEPIYILSCIFSVDDERPPSPSSIRQQKLERQVGLLESTQMMIICKGKTIWHFCILNIKLKWQQYTWVSDILLATSHGRKAEEKAHATNWYYSGQWGPSIIIKSWKAKTWWWSFTPSDDWPHKQNQSAYVSWSVWIFFSKVKTYSVY